MSMMMNQNLDNQGLLYVCDFPEKANEKDIINFFEEFGFKVIQYKEGISK